jgi:hypothetical protein
MSIKVPGVYSIVNRDITGVLSWGNQSNNLVTLGALTPWDHTTTLLSSKVAFMELWLVEPWDPSIQPPTNEYTMRNLSSGKYLTSRNGSSVILENPTSNFTFDRWIITQDPSGYYNISNTRFTSTSTGNIGFNYNQVNAVLGSGIHERWDLQKVSMSGPDIVSKLFNSSIINQNRSLRDSRLHILDSEYLILSRGMLKEIWISMKKHKYRYRRDSYDEDDFAIALKSAVAKWGVQSVLRNAKDSDAKNSNNIAFFCAFMVAGPNPRPDPNSVPVPSPNYNFNGYNITLSADSSRNVLFFDPKNGNFVTPSTSLDPHIIIG